jgi:glycosyltransferase involved in cell wall biosynthesis
MVSRALKRPLYRAYQLGYWLRRREWRVVATLLRGGPPPRASGAAPAPQISIALTVYNRAAFALEAVRQVAADPRVAEIVVSDDASEPSDYQRLYATLTELSPKVRMHRNERNRGPLWNKHRAVSLCTSDFAILFDSDNVLDTGYLDSLFAAAPWRRDCFYCPEYARPHFDRRMFGGVTLDLALVRRALRRVARDRPLELLLDAGNFLTPVREYCDAVGPFQDLPRHADAFIASYLWMRQGGRLHVLRGLAYDHRVHDGSYARLRATDAKGEISDICRAIRAQRTWPEGAEEGSRGGADRQAVS